MKAVRVTEGDIVYVSFTLTEVDNVSGSISYYDLSRVDTIKFRMRKYGSTINSVDIPLQIVNAKMGQCRGLTTIPPSGRYISEVEVIDGSLKITWEGPRFIVRKRLG